MIPMSEGREILPAIDALHRRCIVHLPKVGDVDWTA